MKQFILVFPIFLNYLHAVSFDCNKASTKVEKAICRSSILFEAEYLSGLDDRLSSKYNIIKETLPDNEKKAFIEEQRQWLKTRNQCESYTYITDCLAPLYKERIAYLEMEYKNVLFNFSSKDEAGKICSAIAKNPKNFIYEYGVESNVFDINNDGKNETIEVTYDGTMSVPVCMYTLNNGKKIKSMRIGFEWKDYWTYNFTHLNVNNKIYRLTSTDNDLKYLAYLSYINPSNEEHILCEFESSTVRTLTPNPKIAATKEICTAVQNQEVTYIDFDIDSKIEHPYSKKNSVAHTWLAKKQGQVDFNNDGVLDNLVNIKYSSGAGRGCDTSYYDEVTSDGMQFTNSETRTVLLKSQGVFLDGIPHPRCEADSKFFQYKDQVFYEESSNGDKWVVLIKNDTTTTICSTSSTIVTSVK